MSLLMYVEILLETLQLYQVTVKLKKCWFFPQSAKFVGKLRPMEIPQPNQRYKPFKIQKPTSPAPWKISTNSSASLVFIRIGSQITSSISHNGNNTSKHSAHRNKHMEKAMMLGTCERNKRQHNNNAQAADELIARPDLAQRNYASRFYLKTDWYHLGMAAPVPLQADPANKMVTRAESKEDAGGPCEFDKANHKLRLRPIAFSSLRCSEHKSSHHWSTGEAATEVWTIIKYQ